MECCRILVTGLRGLRWRAGARIRAQQCGKKKQDGTGACFGFRSLKAYSCDWLLLSVLSRAAVRESSGLGWVRLVSMRYAEPGQPGSRWTSGRAPRPGEASMVWGKEVPGKGRHGLKCGLSVPRRHHCLPTSTPRASLAGLVLLPLGSADSAAVQGRHFLVL